jgi:hypothetical protein
MAYLVGQQDVFRHIMMMLNITEAELYRRVGVMTNDSGEGFFNDD